MKNISAYKNLLTTLGVTLICLTLYGIFPTKNLFQQIISSIVFLLVVPLLYIKIILKGSLKDFGIQVGNVRKGITFLAVSLFLAVPAFYVIFHYTLIFQNYRPPQIITERFIFFVLYEIFAVGLFTLLYEFFFRGFVLFGTSKTIRNWSILIQFLLLLALYFATERSDWSVLLYTISAPLSGITAYQSRSIYYSFGTTLFFIIIADALAIGFTKT